MKVQQAYLIGKTVGGENLTMTTWLDVQPKLKQGAVITLKDFPDVKWLVETLYENEHDATDFDFHRTWDNNDYSKHTGLNI
jgi:hypothetical protein